MTFRSYQKFALVVPTLNEAENITTVLDRVTGAMSMIQVPWEVLVVDDDSDDSTGRKVLQYAESDRRVRLLVRRSQRGLAGAVSYGWAQTDADLLGVIDADLQHPPELLPTLINKVCEGFDVAVASRYLRPNSTQGWSLIRRVVSRLSIVATVRVQKSAVRVKDPMSGFFVLRRECIEGLSLQPTGFKVLLEILATGHVNSAVEVPFTFAPRHYGKSKANGMTALHYISLLYKLSRYVGPQPRRCLQAKEYMKGADR